MFLWLGLTDEEGSSRTRNWGCTFAHRSTHFVACATFGKQTVEMMFEQVGLGVFNFVGTNDSFGVGRCN